MVRISMELNNDKSRIISNTIGLRSFSNQFAKRRYPIVTYLSRHFKANQFLPTLGTLISIERVGMWYYMMCLSNGILVFIFIAVL